MVLEESSVRMLDLFCGRFGWSKAFAARGWECVGVDLVEPPEIPQGCEFYECDVFNLSFDQGFWIEEAGRYSGIPSFIPLGIFDFICASSPCDEFSPFQMPWTRARGPAYPKLGIRLFNHTRQLCEASGVPYCMENVRAAQQFVGYARRNCGPFYLWGNGIPELLPYPSWRKKESYGSKEKGRRAEIPPELAGIVADYAERLLEMKQDERQRVGR